MIGGDNMLQIIKSDKIVSFKEAENQYKGNIVLMIDKGDERGSVYAVADFKDLGKLTKMQIELLNEGIETAKVRNLGTDNYTLATEGWGIL